MDYQKIMFVSAHPDDEIGGAGGTLLKLKSLGAEIMLVLAIDPSEEKSVRSAKEEKELRLGEFGEVASQMGARHEYLGFSNYPELNKDTIKPLVRIVRSFKPDVVMMLSEEDYHTEHQMVARIVKRAVWHSRRDAFIDFGEPYTVREIWEAEGDRPMHDPNYLEDISEFIEEKMRLFSIYYSQVKNKDLSLAAMGLNSYRGIMYKKGRHAEAFYRTNLIYG